MNIENALFVLLMLCCCSFCPPTVEETRVLHPSREEIQIPPDTDEERVVVVAQAVDPSDYNYNSHIPVVAGTVVRV